MSGERWGYGNDAEGFTAYSGGEWFRLVVDDGRDRFRRSGSCDGGQVGGCVVAAAAGDGGHPAAEDVELGGFVESGEVFDRVDGGHVDRPFAVPVGATARVSNTRSICRMCW